MDDFKAVMTEWLSLKHQLAAARKDMAVLNKREKELRAQVQGHMKEIKETQDVDTVKVNQEKVSLHTKESRGSITKNVILAGLRAYFGGDDSFRHGVSDDGNGASLDVFFSLVTAVTEFKAWARCSRYSSTPRGKSRTFLSPSNPTKRSHTRSRK